MSVMLLVLAVLSTISLLALADQYRTLELIRDHLGINDYPRPVDVRRDAPPPSTAGLPNELDEIDHVVLLFVTTSCSTCKTVATSLRGKVVPTLRVVLSASTEAAAREWLRDVGLSAQQVILDGDNRVSGHYGISVAPAAIVLRRGRVVVAQTVPSFRQIEPLLSANAIPAAAVDNTGR